MPQPNRNAQDRKYLHLTKVEEFARYAESIGYKRAATKGEFEVLRLRPTTGSVLIWHRRVGCDHATSAIREARLVRMWLRSRD